MSRKNHVVCPVCGQVNAVPSDKPVDKAVCGSCGAHLFPGQPIEADERTFAKLVARSHLPVVVDFWAPWCGPCQMMAPQFEEAARQNNGKVHFVKLNTEAAQSIAAQYNIRSIPTMALFQNGAERTRTSGAMQAPQITAWIHQNL